MSFLNKVELKFRLKKMGINVVKGNYVRKSDITKCLANTEYKGFGIDKSEVDDYENYLIYDGEKGEYLGDLLNEGQPIAYTIEEAKKLIEWYIKNGNFKNYK